MSKSHRLTKFTAGLGSHARSARIHGRQGSSGTGPGTTASTGQSGRGVTVDGSVTPGLELTRSGSLEGTALTPESTTATLPTYGPHLDPDLYAAYDPPTRCPATSSQVQIEDLARPFQASKPSVINFFGKGHNQGTGGVSAGGPLQHLTASTKVVRLPRSATSLPRGSLRRSPSPGSSPAGSPFNSPLFPSAHGYPSSNAIPASTGDAVSHLLSKFGMAHQSAHFHTSAKKTQTASSAPLRSSEMNSLHSATSSVSSSGSTFEELDEAFLRHLGISSASHAWNGDNYTNQLMSHSVEPKEGKNSQYAFDHGAYGIPKRSGGPLDHVSTFEAKGTRAKMPAHLHNAMGGECSSTQVGEDAFFLRSDALGIADGVGGWRRHAPSKLHGLSTDPNAPDPRPDPGLFSLLLTHHMHTELARMDDPADPRCVTKEYADPVDILTRSWRQTIRDAARENFVGSATAILALLRGDELRVAHLGDCAFAILREGEFIFRSEEQQVSFNYPRQIGTNSPGAAEVAQSDARWEEERDRMLSEQIRQARDEVYEATTGHGSHNAKPAHGSDQHDAVADANARLDALLHDLGTLHVPNGDRSGGSAFHTQDRGSKIGSEERGDRPSDAQSFAIKVKKDDIVVISTDGLVDNLYDEDILEEVLKHAKFGSVGKTATGQSGETVPFSASQAEASHDTRPGSEEGTAVGTSSHYAALWSDWSRSMSGLALSSMPTAKPSTPTPTTDAGAKSFTKGPLLEFHPGKAAQSLALAANSIATDPRSMDCPFGTKAMEQGIYWQGGKPDDVTVIVACIGDRV